MITTTTAVTSVETFRGKVGIVVVIVLALTTVSSVSGVKVGLNIELSGVADDAGGTYTVVAMFLPQKVTSARCTHAVRAMNCKVSMCIIICSCRYSA